MKRKPLGRKAYGSIGHLPSSRLGPGDHKITDGQARILTQQTRDKHDIVYVREKLDGCCMSVARVDCQIVALGRAGYTADSAPYEHMRLFGRWVRENPALFDWIEEGWRAVGEWMAMAHGTMYELKGGPFYVFDYMKGAERATQVELAIALDGRLPVPKLLHSGGACPLSDVLQSLGEFGHHGATEPAEGVVYRVERKGKVDFLGKWVRPDKRDGCYLMDRDGGDPIWLWRIT